MNLEKKLQSVLGLTQTESAIYIAALPYESVGVHEVTSLTGIKRTTIYHAVDSLVLKGFMAKKNSGGKTLYSTVSPEFLDRALETKKIQLEGRQKELKNLIPDLSILQKGPIFTTEVQHFQGVAGVKAVYEEALYCKSRRWDAISPLSSFAEQYGQDMVDYTLSKRKERGIHTRTLWEMVKKTSDHPVAMSLRHERKRDVRLVPKSMRGRFRSKIIIFDNRVALITPASDPGAVLIKSAELHMAFQALFDTLWDISDPIK